MGGICTKHQSQNDQYDLIIEEELPIKQVNKSERCISNSIELKKMLLQQQRQLFQEEQITDGNLTHKGILKTNQSYVSRQKSQKRVHFHNKVSVNGVYIFRSSKNRKSRVTLSMLDSIF